MNFGLCIITYNGEKTIEKTFESIINQLKKPNKILIIDNNSSDKTKDLIKNFKNRYPKYVELILNKKNYGVGYALNQGIKWARENKFSWIAFSDQDSIFDKNVFYVMDEFIKDNIEDIAIVAPVILSKNGKFLCFKKKDIKKLKKEDKINVDQVITSGSLIKVEVSDKIGLFRSDFFIDFIDYEFCLRLKKHNFKIIVLKKAKVYHSLGEERLKKFLFLKLSFISHPSWRYYFLVRNELFTYLYEEKSVYLSFLFFLKFAKLFLKILVLEEEKFKKLVYILKGLFHAFSKKLSEI